MFEIKGSDVLILLRSSFGLIKNSCLTCTETCRTFVNSHCLRDGEWRVKPGLHRLLEFCSFKKN